jgi:hypothetical protein
VSAVGRRYFGLADNPALRVVDADARPFLRASRTHYDIITVDAYRQPYVPFYLTTREFFREVRTRLRPGGVVALNITTLPGDDRLARAVAGTLAHEFPQVLTWQALTFNQLVVGLRDPLSTDELRARLSSVSDPVGMLTRLFAADARPARPAAHPWTDDLAPVEWITDRMIVSYGVSGADRGETLLPTHP